jgi:hypothetical protein
MVRGAIIRIQEGNFAQIPHAQVKWIFCSTTTIQVLPSYPKKRTGKWEVAVRKSFRVEHAVSFCGLAIGESNCESK